MDKRYPDTIRLLVDRYPMLTPELQKAARFMVEHPEEIGLNSMRRVARDAGVKPATMTRLTKELGFSEYDALREPFRQRLRTRSPDFASKLQSVQKLGESGEESLFAELRAQELSNIEHSLSDENFSILDAAATTLHDSRRVYVLGLRGAHAPAFLFHYAYQLFQDNSQLLDTSAGIFADQLAGDLLPAIHPADHRCARICRGSRRPDRGSNGQPGVPRRDGGAPHHCHDQSLAVFLPFVHRRAGRRPGADNPAGDQVRRRCRQNCRGG